MAQSCLNSKMIKVFRIKIYWFQNNCPQDFARERLEGSTSLAPALHSLAWPPWESASSPLPETVDNDIERRKRKLHCTARERVQFTKSRSEFHDTWSQSDRKLGRFGSPPIRQMNCKQVETLQASKQSRLLLWTRVYSLENQIGKRM